jgi:hypothetical protein
MCYHCQYNKKHCGSQDYGAALSIKLHRVLEENLEAILISLDVAGAFDKVWWAGLLAGLKHCGMNGKAHKLLSSYLYDRILWVVANGIASSMMKYSCGVPQGVIWSPKFWNFYMRELPNCLLHTESFNYADDSALLKVFGSSLRSAGHISIRNSDRERALYEITQDLDALEVFGSKWKVTFEPTKTHAMLVSNTQDCFYPAISQLVFCGKHIVFEEVLLLVGFLFDRKLTWKPMLDRVCSKSRQALGAVFRLKSMLRPSDIAVLYKAFVRSALEYGLLEYFAAAPGYLSKLDKIQRAAEKMCGMEFTPLGDRREAAAFGLICKLLAGGCVEQLQMQCPSLDMEIPIQCSVASRVRSKPNARSELDPRAPKPKLREQGRCRVDSFQRSVTGQMATIFSKIPEDILQLGLEKGWNAAMKPGQRFLASSKVVAVKLRENEFFVERVIGTDITEVGRRYKVVWKGYSEVTWEREANLMNSKDAVVQFWLEFGEEMPESMIFKCQKQKQKQKQHRNLSKGTDKVATKKYEEQMKKDLMFRG